jgi:hypothetical protein
VITQGVDAYFRGSYALFFIYDRHEMAAILDRVYRPQEPLDKATLCEACALAAIGSHYDASMFDVSIMENLHYTAAIYVSDCTEAHFLRGMRVILCLSMYSCELPIPCHKVASGPTASTDTGPVMTKRLSARQSIGTASNSPHGIDR